MKRKSVLTAEDTEIGRRWIVIFNRTTRDDNMVEEWIVIIQKDLELAMREVSYRFVLRGSRDR